MRDDDLTPAFESAFRERALSLSDSGRYLEEQSFAESRAAEAGMQEAAREWVRAQGMGDAIPSMADYDYARMLSDGVYPAKDGAGRVPLPPRYYRPGRMVLGGVDLATGQRIESAVPLEDRLLSGQEDDASQEQDAAGVLAALSGEELAALPLKERAPLEAWAESHGIMLAQGGTQATASDAPPVAAGATRSRPPAPKLSDLADLGQPAQALWDALAGALKGATAQTLGLPGDVESLVRMLAGGEQVMPTTEDMEARLPPVIPPQASDLVAPNPRAHSAKMGEKAGELGGLGKAPQAVVKGVAAGAKAIMKAAE